MVEKKAPLLVWFIGILFTLGSLYFPYIFTRGFMGPGPTFIESLSIYFGAGLVVMLSIFLVLKKNWARIIFIYVSYILGIFLVYLSWDFIRTLNPFFDDEIIKLVLGILCIALGIYLQINGKVKEAFVK